MTQQIGVADFIRQLRSDLESAIGEGKGKTLRFDVEALDVELQVTATVDASAGAKGGGGLKLAIFSGDASAETKAAYSTRQVQTVRLKLKAIEEDSKGGSKRAKLKGNLS